MRASVCLASLVLLPLSLCLHIPAVGSSARNRDRESSEIYKPFEARLAPETPDDHSTCACSMDASIDLSDASKALDLENIRFQLIRLEDTITFHLIERVQFPLNRRIYIPGAVKIPGSELSLMDYVLSEQERLQSRVRRYQSPDEYPFFPDVVETPILQPLQYPKILHENDVNVNDVIKSRYINEILPSLCKSRDRGEAQENYGSSATSDVSCLQALSRRIHFGKFVAESKFLAETDKFVKLIKAEDRDGIEEAITNSKVERMVLDRLRLKAKTYGRDPANPSEGKSKIDFEAVVSMYKVGDAPVSHSSTTPD
ncbi:chorismate mutase [Trichophyton rubrum D6]|uniref:Chorismate mutase n=3 Tax=Trichophyton TaxID=5550 RepID=A0A080WEJ7_TRIRC|nr:chorismate mutase [Trichophyton rubrum CBS 118892]EZF09752.1 chorismate mutase [Trichophyton rubrum MR850]EZF36613.1 chorismate mutase [Trichophyton rubrum CBS 100081]EZF47259.1 chorismate mutase [Trichophyton rubrum CBS 288.86]EZF57916.1 chorismate mutase [Trichophyton rubrum CBS 289.86]EZF68495.1 chorismate mutase [Trichophyton soudanense CBS 452.61]EZF79084.1 chorismate mutase [Trichophyton rubrum MR1448]EZF89889.1 chorismate mutase [Trichophyton rubrum MR1459]EZG00744.1 chorismate mu